MSESSSEISFSAKITSVLFQALFIWLSSMIFLILPMFVSAEATTQTKWASWIYGLSQFNEAIRFAIGPPRLFFSVIILVTNLMAINWLRSDVEIGIFFFHGMTSLSFQITNATAASLYLPLICWAPASVSGSAPRLDGLPLGVPATDPEINDWFTPVAFFQASGLTNLKAKLVLNPRSILYFKECQRHPDFEEFLVEVILSTLVYWSNLMSPSYTSPVRVEKSLYWNEKDRSFSL